MKPLAFAKPNTRRRRLLITTTLVLIIASYSIYNEYFTNKHKYIRKQNLKKNNDEYRREVIIETSPSRPILVDSEISRLIKEENENGIIRNRHFIESHLTSSSLLVILIQVHSRLTYLKELIESLRATKYIEQALVVFSHDIYDEKMIRLVRSIDFCSTRQIYYQYSMQIYEHRFPGRDSCDCPKNLKKSESLLLNCCNAAYSDSFGHNREAEFVQIKHHWTWKLAFMFETLKETKQIKNLQILLIEEDHFLVPDAIFMLRKLNEKVLSDIDVVSLGVFDQQKQNIEPVDLDKYGKAIWHSSAHNTGLLISRPQWNMLKDCFHAFCTYDDYNWDWSLQYVSQRCFKSPLVAIFPIYSRVFHIGTCGIHHKGESCDPSENVNNIKSAYERKKGEFFAPQLTLDNINTGIKRVRISNGGWSDPRDHQLCKQFFFNEWIFNNHSDIIHL